jgi:GNAT superfamily N-acetyltransferase
MHKKPFKVGSSWLQRIKEKFGLKNPPKVTVKSRPFIRNASGRYKLDAAGVDIHVSSESFLPKGYFDSAIGTFRDTYRQLWKDTQKGSHLKLCLMEVYVTLGKVDMPAGYNWLITGVLKTGERYCAICDVMVWEIFRGCGLMTLLKREEIEWARQRKCDFIQTWHAAENPDFNSAIIPSLKKGFVLYHGLDDEEFEESGCINLRYYFERRKIHNVQVLFRDGEVLQSPRQNGSIIDHLLKFKKYPGKSILQIKDFE